MTARNQRQSLALVAVLSLMPASARAQTSVSGVLSFLLTNQSVITDNFVQDRDAAQATSDTIARFVQAGLSTLPLSASAGGFIYRFNPTVGTMERVGGGFGPFFLERTRTVGREEVSVAFSFRHLRFDDLDGRSLRDGTLVTTANQLANEPQPFDQQLLTLRMEADTYTLFGSYGATDRLELGAAIPLVDLRLSGERFNNYRGSIIQQASGTAHAVGLADVALRAKYNIGQTADAGFATSVTLRLPTGDEEQLLGAGSASLHVSAIASLERGRIGSHVEAGFGDGGVSDDLTFGGAVVVAAAQRLSIVGELLGRRLNALGEVGEATAPHPLVPNVTTTRLIPTDTGTTTMLGLVGFKWNLGTTWLLNANVLFPLTDTGLTGPATPSITLDYTF